jgi:hypothetical protein
LTREEKEVLSHLHKEVQAHALEMRHDEINEISGQIENRWKWGNYVDDAFDEKKYGENQVELLATFLGKRPEVLWEVRRFYRAFDRKQVKQLINLRRENGRPLPWAVILETLRRQFGARERQRWLKKAAAENMDHRTLRKAINETLQPEDNVSRGKTAKSALNTATRQAERFQQSSAEFDETLEAKLLKGNADDFTDEVMERLQTTRSSLLEMRATIDLHLQLVDDCLTRGSRLREEQAQQSQDLEESDPAIVVETEENNDSETTPVRKKAKRKRRRVAADAGDGESPKRRRVKKRRGRPRSGSPEEKVAKVRRRLQVEATA